MLSDIKIIIPEFLREARTANLKTRHYPKEYFDLKLKVSFGQGNSAKVPWISFLGNGQSTSLGIYPVLLFFKDFDRLILAYGISEENKPMLSWNVDSETVNEYFNNESLRPDRYGTSFVYKAYDTNSLNLGYIENDLNDLINQYKLLLSKNVTMPVEILNHVIDLEQIQSEFSDAGLVFSEELVTRFVGSLIAKPFVILTGLSGSGKTKLAQAFAAWICENDSQFAIVPIGADWTNREPLLGFPNALQDGQYVKPDNRALDLLIKAVQNPNKPFFLILDEMNLSHVERYFADFLSAMESKDKITLHAGKEEWNEVPPFVRFPNNLFIVGTVNIDETTYMFSPKVLDRANTIEFKVTTQEMEHYLQNRNAINLDKLKAGGASISNSFLSHAKDENLALKKQDKLHNALILFFVELKKVGAEFGYRTAGEIERLAGAIALLQPSWLVEDIVDVAIMQKLLPKVHGSRRKLEPVLKALTSLCESDTETPKYPISHDKIKRMHNNLIANGFTSYAEA